MRIWLSASILATLALVVPTTAASAQAGLWQCEYGTRNVHRRDAHAVAYQAMFNVHQNGYVEAMLFNRTYPTGDIIASSCQRVQ